jgi:hypothetical protein
MIWYLGGLVVSFVAGAAVMFFVLKNNPSWLGIEDKLAWLKGMTKEEIQKILDTI